MKLFKILIPLLFLSLGLSAQELGLVDADTARRATSNTTRQRLSSIGGKVYFRGATLSKNELVSTNNTYSDPSWLTIGISKVTGLTAALALKVPFDTLNTTSNAFVRMDYDNQTNNITSSLLQNNKGIRLKSTTAATAGQSYHSGAITFNAKGWNGTASEDVWFWGQLEGATGSGTPGGVFRYNFKRGSGAVANAWAYNLATQASTYYGSLTTTGALIGQTTLAITGNSQFTGDVGIGVAPGTYKLNVIGTFNASGLASFGNNIELPSSTTSGLGVITKGGIRFIHDFHHPTGSSAIPSGSNIFIGNSAGNFTAGSTATNTFDASNNIAMGASSLGSLTIGNTNIGIGTSTLTGITTGSSNVAIGHTSLFGITTTSNNTAIGNMSARYLPDGTTLATGINNSVYIGAATKTLAASQSNETVIGYNATGNGSNTMTFGNTSVTNNYFQGGINLPSTGTNGYQIYNTVDQVTNFERLTIKYVSNTAIINSEGGGSGSARNLQLTAGGSSVFVISPATTPVFSFLRNTGVANSNVVMIAGTYTALSGITNFHNIFPTINQTSTAGYRGLFISPFEQANGSGVKFLIDAGTNSAAAGAGTHTSKFNVDNTGLAKIAGSVEQRIRTVTTTASANLTDYTILADATSAAFTITLPTAASAYDATMGVGAIINIKKIDASVNIVTIQGSGAELIYTTTGSNTQTLVTQGLSYTLQSNGTSWFIY